MDKSKRDTVRMVSAEARLQRGQLADALQDVKAAAARWPHSRIVWNCAARLEPVRLPPSRPAAPHSRRGSDCSACAGGIAAAGPINCSCR